MNREVKFRGKGIADNEWYYGDLIQVESGRVHYFIIQDYEIKEERIELNTCASPEVNPETVGQFTGLDDKNGKEIYEGDIVQGLFADQEEPKIKGQVIYSNGQASYIVIASNNDEWELGYLDNLEVIGNEYDNPELLGGE